MKYSQLTKFTFSLLIIICGVKGIKAATPIIHVLPKPDWISPYKPYHKRPALRNIKNGAYDELVEEQVNVENEATYNHIITEIVSESGVQNNSEISVSFNPSYEKLDFHEITVWRNNIPQVRLKAVLFKILPEENELNKFIYNGTYSAKYILADIRKNDKIEYSYTITGTNPIFNHKFSRTIYLQGSDLMQHQYTTLTFPTNRNINIKSFNLHSPPKITVIGNSKRYEWEDFQLQGTTTNKFVPAWFNEYSRVQVSEYSSWTEVISWGLKINPLQTSFAGELNETIKRLQRQSGGDREKYFRSAVELVQNEVRYMGIETGAYSHQANLPAKVLNQRYGDCKDKSLLLASILNADGIESHMVLINTDLREKIDNLLPSPILFDHAVVFANVNGRQVYIDPTIAYQGGKGTDLYFPPYGEGLILKAGNTGLKKIKETKAGKIVSEEKYNIVDEYAPVKLKITTTYTLNHADDERDHLATTGIAETEKHYLDYYSKIYNKIEISDSLIIKDNDEKNELTTIENYKIKNFFKRDSVKGKYTADFYADDISHQLPQIDGQINTPISLNYPYAADYTVNIYMPNGWDITDEHYSLKRDAYTFISDRTVKGSKLSLRYQFAYLKSYLLPDKLPEFRQDIKDLKDDKLSYSFFYIPDIKKTPFKVNIIMLIITAIIICAFTYWGLAIYKTETIDTDSFNVKRYPMPLAGWLIVLIIALFTAQLSIMKYLFEEDFYAMSKWDLVTTGAMSVISRGLLVFEVVGYLISLCLSIFCLTLVFKRRDISPYYLKIYYMATVTFLLFDCLFNAFIDGKILNYSITHVFEGIITAVIWTYYLNTSDRVSKTFVIPYPN